ncbi:MAG: DNA recombination protein RmuC [Dermatophilaceae bacterium]
MASTIGRPYHPRPSSSCASCPGKHSWPLRWTPTPGCTITPCHARSSWRHRRLSWLLLRTVAATWQHDALAQGARELLTLGEELYARLGTVARHTDEVGKALRRSVEAYNSLVGSIESRLLVTARSMHALGLSHEEIAGPATVTTGTRPITAAELLTALDADMGRPHLDLDLTLPEFEGPAAAAG